MDNIPQFLEQYEAWSNQEKFKNNTMIYKLIGVVKKQLLNNDIYSYWPLISGPYYFAVMEYHFWKGLGLFLAAVLLLIGLFVISPKVALLGYIAIGCILCFFSKTIFLSELKKRFDTYRQYDPEAPTPYFNISTKRLVLCLIFTNGLYMLYWFYRNFKALKTAQQLPIIPWIRTLFCQFTSLSVFRGINYSYARENTGLFSAILFFLISGMQEANLRQIFEMSERSMLIVNGLCLVGLIILLCSFQGKILFYCRQENQEQVSGFTLGEVIWIVIGGVTAYPILIGTLLLLI